jgi:TusA-related sulfurtransferase
MENKKNGSTSGMFESILQADVPKGRDGKHKQVIRQLIEAIEQLNNGSALKIALDELPDSKENIRSALSRATKQQNMDVATSSDDKYLYVWRNGH